ncbi:MAG: thiamine phosphate synthase [Pseudomonadota bacterium]|nr:thiamine phosphate synthase [Pseudomonadota bacterium]
MNQSVEISVALIFKRIGFDWLGPCRNDILFIQRNKEPFYKYFELPGGKINNNEDPLDALKRELSEELGFNESDYSDTELYNTSKPIGVRFFNKITHHYQDLSVAINIFILSIPREYKIFSPEGRICKFMNPLLNHNKFIESTYRIYRLFEIPTQLFITSNQYHFFSFPDSKNNINAIRIRKNSNVNKKYNLDIQKTIDFIKRHDDMHHKQFLPHVHGRKLIIIDTSDEYDSLDYEYKEYIGGLHYTSSQLLKLNKQNLWKRENNLQYISASCHNRQEINIANNLNLDFIILSPVLIDKSGRRKLGWHGFSQLVTKAHMPVLALGGIDNTDEDYLQAIQCGGHGIAGISKFWNKF